MLLVHRSRYDEGAELLELDAGRILGGVKEFDLVAALADLRFHPLCNFPRLPLCRAEDDQDFHEIDFPVQSFPLVAVTLARRHRKQAKANPGASALSEINALAMRQAKKPNSGGRRPRERSDGRFTLQPGR